MKKDWYHMSEKEQMEYLHDQVIALTEELKNIQLSLKQLHEAPAKLPQRYK